MGNGSSIESTKTVYLDINGKSEKVRNRHCFNQHVEWIYISEFIIFFLFKYFLCLILNVNNFQFISLHRNRDCYVICDVYVYLCVLYFHIFWLMVNEKVKTVKTVKKNGPILR